MTFAINRDAITEDVLKDGSMPTYTAVPIDLAAGPDGTDFSADQSRFPMYAPMTQTRPYLTGRRP